jgi:hypothetical protein
MATQVSKSNFSILQCGDFQGVELDWFFCKVFTFFHVKVLCTVLYQVSKSWQTYLKQYQPITELDFDYNLLTEDITKRCCYVFPASRPNSKRKNTATLNILESVQNSKLGPTLITHLGIDCCNSYTLRAMVTEPARFASLRYLELNDPVIATNGQNAHSVFSAENVAAFHCLALTVREFVLMNSQKVVYSKCHRDCISALTKLTTLRFMHLNLGEDISVLRYTESVGFVADTLVALAKSLTGLQLHDNNDEISANSPLQAPFTKEEMFSACRQLRRAFEVLLPKLLFLDLFESTTFVITFLSMYDQTLQSDVYSNTSSFSLQQLRLGNVYSPSTVTAILWRGEGAISDNSPSLDILRKVCSLFPNLVHLDVSQSETVYDKHNRVLPCIFATLCNLRVLDFACPFIHKQDRQNVVRDEIVRVISQNRLPYLSQLNFYLIENLFDNHEEKQSLDVSMRRVIDLKCRVPQFSRFAQQVFAANSSVQTVSGTIAALWNTEAIVCRRQILPSHQTSVDRSSSSSTINQYKVYCGIVKKSIPIFTRVLLD